MSGEAERAGELEEQADAITAEFVQMIQGLLTALKDAERERERLVGALETISRAGSVRTGVNGYEEFATGDARMEALADIAREALQKPAPQGAEAGE